ncbi:PAS domain-containing protein [Patulibacter sp.]|uniref:PAS domain-containing protein n=1 Tax=Patulibacter sp. TaxID=1912859 RepID=UPI00272396B5|nr:PAS domain-containing protein [Patulibacter sp.]MDO9410547.1 PAS domain-containing protein [Patulibacter sp.]
MSRNDDTRTRSAAGSDPFSGGGALASHIYSSGRVPVSARPIRGAAQLAELVSVITAIRGVAGAVLERRSGSEAFLHVDLERPVGLGEELRVALGREVETCTLVDGRIELTLTDHGLLGDTGSGDGDDGTSGDRRRGRPDPRQASDPRFDAEFPVDDTGHRSGAGPGPGAATGRRATGTGALTVAAARAATDLMVAALHFSSGVSVLVLDVDLRVLAAAGAVHREWCSLPDPAAGSRIRDALDPSTWTALEPGLQTAMAGATVAVELVSGDGVRTWETTCSPVLVEGRVDGVLLVVRDVSDRRRDTALGIETTDVLELTFGASPVPQALLTPDGRWAKVNHALCVLLGRDEATLQNLPAPDVTHPEGRADAERLLLDLAAEGEDHRRLRTPLVHADGTTIPVELRVSRVRSDDGGLRGFVLQVVGP